MSVFVGREKIIQDFLQSLGQVRGVSLFRRIIRFLTKEYTLPTQARLYSFYGNGGFGKSYLVRRLGRIAKGEGYSTVMVDFDDFLIPNDRKQLQTRKVIEVIYQSLKKHWPDEKKLFQSYEDLNREHRKILRKINSGALKEFTIEAAGEASELIHKASKLPAQVATSLLLEIFEEKLPKWIRRSRILNEDEILLFGNINRKLGECLSSIIHSFSDDKPVCIIFDTFELVDKKSILRWFQKAFLPALINENFGRVIVIISGRNDHSIKLREELSEILIYQKDLGEILFNHTDIKSYGNLVNVELSKSEIDFLYEGSAGIPLIINEIFGLISQNDKKTILTDLVGQVGTYNHLFYGIVNRFLKYSNKEDRDKIFQMALLRKHDNELLQLSWELKGFDFGQTIQNLAKRHSFIDPRDGALQMYVKSLCLKYIKDQIREKGPHKSYLIELCDEISLHAKNRLVEFENSYSNLKQKHFGSRFTNVWLDYCHVSMFSQSEQLIITWRRIFLEALMWDRSLIESTISIIEDSIELSDNKFANEFKLWVSIRNQFGELSHESINKVVSDRERLILKKLNDYNSGLNEGQKCILSWLNSINSLKEKDYALSYKFLSDSVKGPEMSINRNKVFNTAFIAGYEASIDKEFDWSLEFYNLAIEIIPDIASAYFNRGNINKHLKNHDEAIIDYTEAINLNPHHAASFYNRGNLLRSLDSTKSALEDYNKAIQLNPDYLNTYKRNLDMYFYVPGENETIPREDFFLDISSYKERRYDDALKMFLEIEKRLITNENVWKGDPFLFGEFAYFYLKTLDKLNNWQELLSKYRTINNTLENLKIYLPGLIFKSTSAKISSVLGLSSLRRMDIEKALNYLNSSIHILENKQDLITEKEFYLHADRHVILAQLHIFNSYYKKGSKKSELKEAENFIKRSEDLYKSNGAFGDEKEVHYLGRYFGSLTFLEIAKVKHKIIKYSELSPKFAEWAFSSHSSNRNSGRLDYGVIVGKYVESIAFLFHSKYDKDRKEIFLDKAINQLKGVLRKVNERREEKLSNLILAKYNRALEYCYQDLEDMENSSLHREAFYLAVASLKDELELSESHIENINVDNWVYLPFN